MLQDLRLAVRLLRKSPAFALVAILSLSIGIGANTAIFSVLNGWLFRPLPVPEPDRITVLAPSGENRTDALFSYRELQDLRAQAAGFSSIFSFAFRIAGLSADGNAQQFVMGAVSGNYFSGLGVEPAIGRLFTAGEGEKSGDEIRVVLSHAYSRARFAGDSNVIGKHVEINGKSAVVIGVAAENFQGTLFGFPLDGFVTLNAIATDSGFWSDPTTRSMNVLGRMKPGISLRGEQASMDVIARRLSDQFPGSNRGVRIRVIPEHDARPVPLVASFVPAIAGLFLFLPALVLFLACLNLASVITARAAARSREMAVRASLGGERFRLIRQLLTETMLIAALGCTGGVLIGEFALRAAGSALRGWFTSASHYSVSMDAGMDWRVFTYSMLAAFAAGLMAGLWPALRVSRADVNTLLHGGNGSAGSPRSNRLRGFLVASQMAGSALLLVISALFIRSASFAEHTDLGFDPHNVFVITLDPALIGYDAARGNALYDDLTLHLRQAPGVDQVGSAFTVPMSFVSHNASIYLPGLPPARNRSAPTVSYNTIDENYLATMRVPLISGREFTNHDASVAIINEAMARRFWPNADPIGQKFSVTSAAGPFLEIVGVAKDGQYRWFTPDRPPYFYIPFTPASATSRNVVIRSSAPAEIEIPAINAAIRQLEPSLPVINVATMDGIVHGPVGLFFPRLAAMLSAVLGFFGLGLATLGAYGVVSLSVTQRTREMGIRIAVGAEASTILQLVMGQALRFTILGIAIGLMLAVLIKSGLAKLLFGVSATDPRAFAAVAFILAAVALLACYLPARRAARISPVDALRSE
jgi:predicted permease